MSDPRIQRDVVQLMRLRGKNRSVNFVNWSPHELEAYRLIIRMVKDYPADLDKFL